MKRVILVLLAIVLLSTPAFAAPAPVAKNSAGYVGVDTCKECHAQQVQSMSRNVHWKKAIKGSPVIEKGCESCHGPGDAHVSAGGGAGKGLVAFTRKESSKEKSAPCLSCHSDSKDLAFWDSGKHKRNDVACIDCHTLHSATPGNLKTAQPGLCITCHKDVRMQLNKQSHHPVMEGKVKCTDCHSAHGGFGDKMIKADSTPDLCYKCHAEKRGPFAFEHPPVAENCGTCHRVHGSNHENLLVAKSPRLCQNCHAGSGHNNRPYSYQNSFTGSATARNRFVGSGCLNCHGNIHGSNRTPYLVR